MVLRLDLFWKELLPFSFTMALGLITAYRYVPFVEGRILTAPDLSLQHIMVILIFFAAFFFVTSKFKKAGMYAYRLILMFIVFLGAQIIFGSVVPSPWNYFLALLAVAVFLKFHQVLVHNVAIGIGIAGISGILGATISPLFAVFLLVLLSFYDIFAVYVTKHMIYMARSMISSGAIFGFVVPFCAKDFFCHKIDAHNKIGEKFMILGSGDIGLPLILASSVMAISAVQAIIVAVFSLIGLFTTHLLFVNQGGRKPMAALPPIATLSIIGYFIAQLL